MEKLQACPNGGALCSGWIPRVESFSLGECHLYAAYATTEGHTATHLEATKIQLSGVFKKRRGHEVGQEMCWEVSCVSQKCGIEGWE